MRPSRPDSTHPFPKNLSAILACLLLVTGCAGISPPGAGGSAAQDGVAQARARPYRQSIDIAGRLSARYQQNGAEQAVHGSFTWSQTAGRTTVSLLSPLGQTLATIDITPDRSTLVQAGQPPRTAADVDALAADALGWPLPVSGLREWLQGFGTDSVGRPFAASPLADAVQVTTVDGWRLTYASWQEGASRPEEAHPRRIDLERSTAQAGDVALRIVIDSWQPH